MCGVLKPGLEWGDCNTGSLIHSIALHVDGAAGPSNLDTYGWSHICSSYHGASADICNSPASLARR